MAAIFDQFVEQIVLKNKLVSDANLNKAKALQQKHGLTLLEILTKTKLLQPKHAEIIQKKWGEKSRAESVIQPPPAVQAAEIQSFTSLKEYLKLARSMDASDFFINVNSPPYIRQNGKMRSLERSPFTPEETAQLIFNSLNERQTDALKRNFSLEICLDFEDEGRYRCCFLKQRCGWEASFRIINRNVPSFETLSLPSDIKRFADYTQGLVLVTGPAGCGKSSTLAAMIELVNQKRAEHIISLEDPVEYVYTPKKSHISQREVGSHTQSFSNALRGALREDPDVILVGEMRDFETASLAVTAAETGHLVFSTLHTIDASQTVMRLLDFFPPDQQNQIRAMISESLRGIVCQRLVPLADGSGRALALEILFNISSISSLIRENKLFQIRNMMRISRQHGIRLMDDSIKELLQNKRIEPGDAHHAMVDSMLNQEQSKTAMM